MSEGKERNTQSGGDERFQRLVLEKKKVKKKVDRKEKDDGARKIQRKPEGQITEESPKWNAST